MRRIVLVSLGLIAGLLLVAGSYPAMAGQRPAANLENTSTLTNQQGGVETGAAAGPEGGDAAVNQKVAQAIADEFGVSSEEVLARQGQGIGFGALFKLYAIARAKGITMDELLTTIPADAEGNREFGFGNLGKSLMEAQVATLESGPKNLGSLVSEASKDHTSPGDEDEASDEGAGRSNGHGPPPFAKAKGRR